MEKALVRKTHFKADAPRQFLPWLSLWVARSRQRQQLSELEAWQLADIAISDPERKSECLKWWWQS
ncbi:DUF1127 domain-containing protein [Afifella marina]|nr:hypothetical protein [Afifella marina]